MGNCSLKSASDEKSSGLVHVLAYSGEIFKCRSPKLARDILKEYPGHRIFRQGQISLPLSSRETLVGGQVYYLVPQGTNPSMFEIPDLGRTLEVLPWQKNGVWKVKMVIGTKQLEEILAEEGNTEALIQRLRMAAAAAATTMPRRGNCPLLVGRKLGSGKEGCM